MMKLQKGIIYGPVNSRRLGRSLGINLSPTKIKICTFDCLYCQYGWTKIRGRELPIGENWPKAVQVLKAVKEALTTVTPPPAYITFSGNGEATLHPGLVEIVDGVIKLRDQLLPGARTAILSNSTMLDDLRVRSAISRLDVKIMKLDCGEEECFQRYNRPAKGIVLQAVIDSLKEIPGITIQALFSGGDEGNLGETNLSAWIQQVKEISPADVQIYTLDRGFPSRHIIPATPEQLMGIKSRLEEIGIPAEAFLPRS